MVFRSLGVQWSSWLVVSGVQYSTVWGSVYTSSIPVTQLQYLQRLLLSILYRLLCFLQLLSCPISGRSAPGDGCIGLGLPHRWPVILQYINTGLSVLVLVKSSQIVLSEFLTSYVHRCNGLGVVLGGPRRCFSLWWFPHRYPVALKCLE